MRTYFKTTEVPKRLALAIKHVFPALKLSQAQEWTAKMCGYRDWHELDKLTRNYTGEPTTDPFFIDYREEYEKCFNDPEEEMSEGLVKKRDRLFFQIDALQELMNVDNSSHMLAEECHPEIMDYAHEGLSGLARKNKENRKQHTILPHLIEQSFDQAVSAMQNGDDEAATRFLFDATDDDPKLAPIYFPYAVKLEQMGSLLAANWLTMYGWNERRGNRKPLLADKDEQNRILARVALNGPFPDDIRFAALELGDRYYKDGEDGSPHAYVEAYKWYEIAYRNGHAPEGAVLIGYLYEEGKGVPKDLPAAVDWFLRVLELPEPDNTQCVNPDDWPAYYGEGWRDWDELAGMLGDATPEERLLMIDRINKSTPRPSTTLAKHFDEWIKTVSFAVSDDVPAAFKELLPNIELQDVWEMFAQVMPLVTAEQSVEFAHFLNRLQAGDSKPVPMTQ